MKQIKFITFLTTILLSLFILSCGDGIDDEDNFGGNNNNLKTGQIELKGYPNNSNKMSFRVTANKMTIDWGDGKIEERTPNGKSMEFVHEYAYQDFQTIKVDTEGMIDFTINNGYSYSEFFGTYHELRLGDCPELKEAYCNYQELTVLDIKKAPALTKLECNGNQLISLDVRGCTALTTLYCYEMNSNELSVIGGDSLKTLSCFLGKLTSLDVSKCTALTTLDCGYNQLTSLNVSKYTALRSLSCGGNPLTSLDVSKCTALISLNCGGNPLTSLDVSKCTALTYLYCDDNPLTSLDVSKCTALIDLSCCNNRLTSLDVSKCTKLTHLYCNSNQLTSSALNSLFNSLPTQSSAYIYIWENPGTSECDKTIAEKKGWSVSLSQYY
jgi:hypothetical protein